MTSPPRIPVGTVGFDGARARSFARLDAVELQETHRGVPGERLLDRLRRDAPSPFVFSLRLPAAIDDPVGADRARRPNLSYLPAGAWPEAPFDTGELGHLAWQWVLGAAERMEARAIFFQTGVSFRPTAQNRERMVSFFTRMPRPRSARIVWDSQGLFAFEDRSAICRELDLVPALDPLMDRLPSDGRAYVRCVGRSRTRHGLSADELDMVAEASTELDWGLVLFHTPSPYRDALALKKLLAAEGAEPSDDAPT